MKIKHVTFLGSSQTQPGEKLYQDAYKAAAEVANAGYVVVNGAGPGIMRASTDGAKSVGGKTIGITFEPKDMMLFEGRDKNNRVDQLIVLKNYVERTLKLLEIGEVYIIFNGGTGTISEFGMAWGLARLYFGHHKPLILFGNFWYPILEAFAQNMKLRGEELKVYKIVDRVEDIVPTIKKFEEELGSNHAETINQRA